MNTVVNILLSDYDFSCSVYQEKEFLLIPNYDYDIAGYQPFAISYCKKDQWLYGSAAVAYARDHYGSTVLSIYDIINKNEKIQLNGQTFEPYVILAKLFERIEADVKNHLGPGVKYTLTLPNDWDLQSVKIIEKAIAATSIHLQNVIKITDCMALNYMFRNPAIEDLKICCLYLDNRAINIGYYEIGNGFVESIATTASRNLNTNLLINKLITFCISEYKAKGFTGYNIDVAYLKAKCEQAFRAVFVNKSVTIIVTDQTDQQKSVYIELTREKLFKIVKPQFDDLNNLIQKTCSFTDNPDMILLDTANYSTPYLLNILKNTFPCSITAVSNYVRQGGALYSGIKGGQIADLLLLESLSVDISILLKNGKKEKLIDANTTIPTMKTQKFSGKARKNYIEVPVFSNDHFIGGHVIFLNSAEQDQNYNLLVTISIDVNKKIKLDVNIEAVAHKNESLILPTEYSLTQNSTYITSELEVVEISHPAE